MAYAEASDLDAHGNHPSFMLSLYGNEAGGPVREVPAEIVTPEAHDPRRLYCAGAGWPNCRKPFRCGPRPTDPGVGRRPEDPHQRASAGTDDRLPRIHGRPARPVVGHEIGQSCVYPNFDEIPKYTGYLKPKNFEIFRETMEALHWPTGPHFLLASGKLQTLCYKEDIERRLRTRDGRLSAARPARLPRPGHRSGRRARSVLGEQRLRQAG